MIAIIRAMGQLKIDFGHPDRAVCIHNNVHLYFCHTDRQTDREREREIDNEVLWAIISER